MFEGMKAVTVGLLVASPAGALAATPDEAVVTVPDAGLATGGRVQVQAQLLAGLTLGSHGDPYGFGVGVDAGFTLPMGLYVGATFARFEGGETDILGSLSPIRAWALQAELGFDLALGPAVVLRPKVGVGTLSVVADVCTDGCSQLGGGELGVTPAVELAYVVSGVAFTAQARVFVDTDEDTFSGYAVGVGLGAAL